MRSVDLALPVLVGTVTVHVAKGRRWSIVEHLLLDAVCRAPRSAGELALAGDIPERMVVESFINLMRVGWVELLTRDGRNVFAATSGGRAVVGSDELPVVTRLAKRSVRYAVERLSGTVLRYRELDFVWSARFRTMAASGYGEIQPSADLFEVRQADVVASMLHEDEEYRGIVPNTSRQGQGFALLSVSGSRIKGLPAGSSGHLRGAILAAAATMPSGGTASASLKLPPVPKELPTFPTRRVTFSHEDVIVGGSQHRDVLRTMIGAARSAVVIHSTFVGTGEWRSVVADLAKAARDRGVRVDILWGKGDRINQDNETRTACEAINAEMRAAGLDRLVRAHAFSTGSHAKLIVADDGRGGWNAVVGSCNWLSSGFTSTEVSLRISDPLAVSDVMEVMAQMAQRVTGLNGGIAARLAGRAVNIRRVVVPSTAKRGELRLVLGPDHAESVLAARDGARRSIVLGSHKFGRSARTLALLPAAAAAKGGDVSVRMYYDQIADGFSRDAVADLVEEYDAEGVQVLTGATPMMHAKFLAWDDDSLLITSQNMLSANPSDPYAEIGVMIVAPDAAIRFSERMEPLLPRGRAGDPTSR
jgi:cardiolipin synthase